jgi:uncharacterized membrane protein YczE
MSYVRPAIRLVGSCLLLGLGVGLVLLAGLGSDGYSTIANGTVRATGLPFWLTNTTFGLVMIALAALRGVRPGVGTLVQPVVVGLSVQAVLDRVPAPAGLPLRVTLLVIGVTLLAVGVAGYLSTGLGAGPLEAAALALRPLPFRVAYSLLQAAGALIGWLLGADVGPGTLIVVLGVGPLVQLLRTRAEMAPATT